MAVSMAMELLSSGPPLRMEENVKELKANISMETFKKTYPKRRYKMMIPIGNIQKIISLKIKAK